MSSVSPVVIYSKVATYTSQPVAFNGHQSTCEHDRTQKPASVKAEPSTWADVSW